METKLNIHIHFNDAPAQTCALKDTLHIGQTATIHFHDKPGDCVTCQNGHCHAPNVSISRIDADTIFVSIEGFPVLECDIKDLPMHEAPEH